MEITKVVKGYSGSPGELHGTFKSDMSSGTIYFNNKYGIFGEMFKPVDSSDGIPMGLKQEIEIGPATIYTTIDGNGPQEYDINIEKIDYKNSGTKNMTIKITDKELLEKSRRYRSGNERKSNYSKRKTYRRSHSCICKRPYTRLRYIL